MGEGEAKRFDADEVSVVLQHYLAVSPLTPAGIRALWDKVPIRRGVDLDAMLSDPKYMGRVIEIVQERKRCGEDTPTLLIVAQPASPTLLLSSDFNLALIFSAETILFQDTIQLLQLDATRWAASGGPKFTVIGVRLDWLTTNGRATRALLTDTDGRVKDFVFAEPVSFDAVMTLHLRRQNERVEHRRISTWCRKHGLLDLNPFSSAAMADDKAATHRLWRRNAPALDAPAFCCIGRKTGPGEMKQIVRSFVDGIQPYSPLDGVFVQPNTGTEGDSVFHIRMGEQHGTEAIIKHAESVLTEDGVLLREERGNVRYRCPLETGQGFRRIAFRVNVTWSGTAFVADSGYAQVAPDEDTPVASRGRGGTIIDINHALSNLHFRNAGRWVRIPPSPAEVENIKRAACDAAAALNTDLSEQTMLRLLGIDILLEAHGKGRSATLHPVLLEANPRPAGLSHAKEVRGISNDAAAQTISLHLFEGIGALLSRRRKNP